MSTADVLTPLVVPRLISIDDHVIEPPTLWTDRVPQRLAEAVPHIRRVKAYSQGWTQDGMQFVQDDSHPDARWADVWEYEEQRIYLYRGYAAVGFPRDEMDSKPLSYIDDDMRPGCYDQTSRLADMDRNHTEASMCFPTIPRFCGQLFLRANDKDVAFTSVQAYNDWMIEDWCGGAGHGRLIPLTLVPLWDAELAAAEVRRCAEKGSHSVTFSEIPPFLGLPSIYSGYWDPFIAACEETETVINMHIGSSSRTNTTGPDAPHLMHLALLFENGMHAMMDWALSGKLAQFPDLKIALSEAQAGWMPFILERMDKVWERNDPVDQLQTVLKEPPSSYIRRQVFGCVYDDLHGLRSRNEISLSQLMFETDYPHADSTWPGSKDLLHQLAMDAGLNQHELWQLARGNAIACYQLDRHFGIQA